MQNVLLRLREVQPSLSSTERQIAQFILDNPDETTTLTIRELARRSFSSPSSVVRICRVIGFQGYKELRHALTLELATLGENGSHREKDITPQDSLQEIVEKVTHKNIQSLLDTQRLLLLDELEQCVELIANARTVLLFGIGSSLCVAKDTYLKFLRLDKPCVVNEDSHSQLLQARNATAAECKDCKIGGFCGGGCQLSHQIDFKKCCTYEEEVFSHFMKTLFIPYIKSKYNEVNQNERKAENRCT